MQIIAHRGGAGARKRRENKIATFADAARRGFLFWETDAQRAPRGALVLAHDYGKLSARLPKLADLLDILPPGGVLNIEIKNDGNLHPGIEADILAETSKRGPAFKKQILISSFDYPTLQRVRALDKSIKIGVLQRKFDVKAALALRAASVNVSHKLLTRKIVQTCHKNGLKIFAYTINTNALAAKLAAQGVDAIFTDYPAKIA